jgi:hypothetical protein
MQAVRCQRGRVRPVRGLRRRPAQTTARRVARR